MKVDKYFIVSFILNILVTFLVLLGTLIMILVRTTGVLEENTIAVFKYFTFQSNVFVGIISAIYATYQILILTKRKDKIPHVLSIFNHVGVSAVGLTFIIVLAFLAPGYGFDKMYNNANLFFHLVVPVVAMVNYMFYIRNEKYHFIQTLYAVLPSLIYGIVYFIIVASNNAYGDTVIDFYQFGKNGPLSGTFNFLAVMVINYLVAIFIYFINRLVFKKRYICFF